MSLSLMSKLVVFLSLAITASANTRFASEPADSCQILGDGDVYGLGIRLGFYLQWLSFTLALVFNREEAHSVRVSFNIFSIAVLFNTFLGAKDSIMVVEWYIVFNMTVILSIVTMFCGVGPRTSHGSLVVSAAICTVANLAQPWLWFKALDSGRDNKLHCPLKVTFLGAPVNAVGRGWVIFNRVVALSCISIALIAISFILLLVYSSASGTTISQTWNILKQKLGLPEEEEVLNDAEANAKANFPLIGIPLMQTLFGLIAILQVELIISRNHIDMSGSPLNASGQLIPFIMGCTTLFRIIWKSVAESIRKRCTDCSQCKHCNCKVLSGQLAEPKDEKCQHCLNCKYGCVCGRPDQQASNGTLDNEEAGSNLQAGTDMEAVGHH
ncbi:hypothetical protein EDC01DRAFT_635678 [Geopyxis carbonaria]|nr:hypothetical protein EDC01DRAFT_635678 [Geopyxis carbonaria]